MAWEPDYCTTQDLANYLRIGDTEDNPEIALAVTAASRAIDKACSRQFGATDSTEERTFETCWVPRLARYSADIDDVMTQVGMVVTVSGATVTNYELRPYNAAEYGRPWRRILTAGGTQPTSGSGPYTVAVEATWGWTAVPDTIKQATLVQAARIFQRRSSPFGVAGSPDLGSEMRLLAKIDADVEVMVAAYRRDWPRV